MTATSNYPVLDPRSLGRPVHLLKDFAVELRALLEDLLRQLLNRRYRAAAYAAGEIAIEAAGVRWPSGNWFAADHPAGRIGCLLERRFVQSVMQHRYGGGATAAPQPEDGPVSSTEERLSGVLARQLLQGLAARLEARPDPDVLALQHAPPARDAWLIRVPISAPGLQCDLLLALDAGWMNRLLRERQPRRTGSHGTAALPPVPPAQLPLTLVARLLQTEMPLGELMALKPGALIPVSLKATEVLVDGARLFTASVAEHQGKLCLTSFADVD